MASFGDYDISGRNNSFLVDELSKNIQNFMKNVTALENKINRSSSHSYRTVQDIVQLSSDTAHLAKLTQESIVKLKKGSIYNQLSQGDRMKLDRNAMHFKSLLGKFHNLHKSATELQEEQVSIAETRRPRFGSAAGSVRSDNPFGEDEEDNAPLMSRDKLANEREMQEVLQMENQATQLEERHHAMRQLQSDMTDLNQIVRDMASMVVEQGDTIDVIETNVDSAANSVEKGTKSLARAAKYKSVSRKLVIIILIVVSVVVVVVIVAIIIVLFATGVIRINNNNN
jgi:uncharacterized Zn ribbon protein